MYRSVAPRFSFAHSRIAERVIARVRESALHDVLYALCVIRRHFTTISKHSSFYNVA